MSLFQCTNSNFQPIETENINECYCGSNYDCPLVYKNGDHYNELSCCISDNCKDPASDICRNLYTVVGLTIGMLFLCCVGAFIFFFCFYRKQRLQREYRLASYAQNAQFAGRPEILASLEDPSRSLERWEVKHDEKGREYYVDHWNKTSTWIKPPELKSLETGKKEVEKPPPPPVYQSDEATESSESSIR